MIFKETRIAFSRWQVAGRNLARALRDDGHTAEGG